MNECQLCSHEIESPELLEIDGQLYWVCSDCEKDHEQNGSDNKAE